MKTLILKRKPDFKSKEFVYRTALESDYKTLIDYNCTMIDEETGKLIGVYLIMPKTPRKLLIVFRFSNFNSALSSRNRSTSFWIALKSSFLNLSMRKFPKLAELILGFLFSVCRNALLSRVKFGITFLPRYQTRS